MAARATRLLDPRGGVHGVAEHHDLALDVAHLADDERPGVQRAAKLGLDMIVAKIRIAPPRQRVDDGEETGDTPCGMAAAPRLPGDDDLVADIAIDLAARREQRLGDVVKDAIEEAVESEIAEPFGKPCRVAQIEQKDDAILALRPMVATSQQREKGAAAEQRPQD